MPCFAPLSAWQMIRPNNKGTRPVIFSTPNFGQNGALNWSPIQLPCNKCVGCKLAKSQEWAIRCVHEAQMHNANCFITLTYNNDNLPPLGNLIKKDFQLFMKRFRKKCGPVRYFSCGEYGSKLGRPHFHALLFGHQFDDINLDKPFKITKSGEKIYRSEVLEKLWTHGWSSVGSLTYQSAAYVARYSMAKINGADAEAHYDRTDPETGETNRLNPEYNTMSLKPGIGATWFEQFGLTDVYPGDFIQFKNRKIPPPKYYDKLLKKIDEKNQTNVLETLKEGRKIRAQQHNENNTPARLRVRAKIQDLKAKRLKREID